MLPPELLAAVQNQSQGEAPEDALLRHIIELVHQAVAMETDPQGKAMLAQILQMLMRYQAQEMKESQPGSQQKNALVGALR